MVVILVFFSLGRLIISSPHLGSFLRGIFNFEPQIVFPYLFFPFFLFSSLTTFFLWLLFLIAPNYGALMPRKIKSFPLEEIKLLVNLNNLGG